MQARPKTPANPKVVALSRGFDAWGKWKDGKASYIPTIKWMTSKGYKAMTEKRYMEFINEHAQKPGIYEFIVGYKGKGGHSTLLRRLEDGTIERIEQQRNEQQRDTLPRLLRELKQKPDPVRGIMRVDNALFNTYYSDVVEAVR